MVSLGDVGLAELAKLIQAGQSGGSRAAGFKKVRGVIEGDPKVLAGEGVGDVIESACDAVEGGTQWMGRGLKLLCSIVTSEGASLLPAAERRKIAVSLKHGMTSTDIDSAAAAALVLSAPGLRSGADHPSNEIEMCVFEEILVAITGVDVSCASSPPHLHAAVMALSKLLEDPSCTQRLRKTIMTWLPWTVSLLTHTTLPPSEHTTGAFNEVVRGLRAILPRLPASLSPNGSAPLARLVAELASQNKDWMKQIMLNSSECSELLIDRALVMWSLQARLDGTLKDRSCRHEQEVNVLLTTISSVMSKGTFLKQAILAWGHLIHSWTTDTRRVKHATLLQHPILASRRKVWEGDAALVSVACEAWVSLLRSSVLGVAEHDDFLKNVFSGYCKVMLPVTGTARRECGIPLHLISQSAANVLNFLSDASEQHVYAGLLNQVHESEVPAALLETLSQQDLPGISLVVSLADELLAWIEGGLASEDPDARGISVAWWLLCGMLDSGESYPPEFLQRAAVAVVSIPEKLGHTPEVVDVMLASFAPLAHTTLTLYYGDVSQTYAKSLFNACCKYVVWPEDGKAVCVPEKTIESILSYTVKGLLAGNTKPTSKLMCLLWGCSVFINKLKQISEDGGKVGKGLVALWLVLIKAFEDLLVAEGVVGGEQTLASPPRDSAIALTSMLSKKKHWEPLLEVVLSAGLVLAEQTNDGNIAEQSRPVLTSLEEAYHTIKRYQPGSPVAEDAHISIKGIFTTPFFSAIRPRVACLQAVCWGHVPHCSVAKYAEWLIKMGVPRDELVPESEPVIGQKPHASWLTTFTTASQRSASMGVTKSLLKSLRAVLIKPDGTLHEEIPKWAEGLILTLKHTLVGNGARQGWGTGSGELDLLLGLAGGAEAVPLTLDVLKLCKGAKGRPERELRCRNLVEHADNTLDELCKGVERSVLGEWVGHLNDETHEGCAVKGEEGDGVLCNVEEGGGLFARVQLVVNLVGPVVAGLLRSGVLHVASRALRLWEQTLGAVKDGAAGGLRYPPELFNAIVAASKLSSARLPGLVESQESGGVPLALPEDTQTVYSTPPVPTGAAGRSSAKKKGVMGKVTTMAKLNLPPPSPAQPKKRSRSPDRDIVIHANPGGKSKPVDTMKLKPLERKPSDHLPDDDADLLYPPLSDCDDFVYCLLEGGGGKATQPPTALWKSSSGAPCSVVCIGDLAGMKVSRAKKLLRNYLVARKMLQGYVRRPVKQKKVTPVKQQKKITPVVETPKTTAAGKRKRKNRVEEDDEDEQRWGDAILSRLKADIKKGLSDAPTMHERMGLYAKICAASASILLSDKQPRNEPTSPPKKRPTPNPPSWRHRFRPTSPEPPASHPPIAPLPSLPVDPKALRGSHPTGSDSQEV